MFRADLFASPNLVPKTAQPTQQIPVKKTVPKQVVKPAPKQVEKTVPKQEEKPDPKKTEKVKSVTFTRGMLIPDGA